MHTMAAINTTRQPEEKVPLWGGLKERFSQGYGVAKSFASRIKSVLETPVSHVAKNVAHRAGDLVHGVEYALATRINNLTKTAPRARETAAEPESWGGEFIDDAATLKVIDYHDAKEKLPAIKAARLQREAVALAEEKQAKDAILQGEAVALAEEKQQKGALMTFAAGQIKEAGVPFFAEGISYAKPVATPLAPRFMDTEYTLMRYLNDDKNTVGDVFMTIKEHYEKQRERGALPPLPEDYAQILGNLEQEYTESGLFASTNVKAKWKHLTQFIDANGVILEKHQLLSFIEARNKNILWDDKDTHASAPDFLRSTDTFTALVTNPSTTVQTIFEAIESHFQQEIAAKEMPAWTEEQLMAIKSGKKQYINAGIFSSNDEETKWSMVRELFTHFGFNLKNHPLIAFSKQQAKRVRAEQEQTQQNDLLKAQ